MPREPFIAKVMSPAAKLKGTFFVGFANQSITSQACVTQTETREAEREGNEKELESRHRRDEKRRHWEFYVLF